METSNKQQKKKKPAISYGLLVFRIVKANDGGLDLEYLIVHPASNQPDQIIPYYLPKGAKEGDETSEEAALRETQEETGIRAKIISKLGTVRYRNGRKEVDIFLAKYSGGRVLEDGRCPDHDWENDDARFVSDVKAKELLRKEFRHLITLANKIIRG